MEIADLEQLKRLILGEIKRDTNGAVAELMSKLNGGEPFFSYGVSLPKIKNVAKQHHPNHELAMVLFDTNIRELKLAAIYIDNPDELTAEQMERWQKSFTSLEIAEHCASMLFSKSNLSLKMAIKWANCSDNITKKAAYLIGIRRANFFYDKTDFHSYELLFNIAIEYLKSSDKTVAEESAENFIAAIANKQNELKNKLLAIFEKGELSQNRESIDWQLL